MSEKAGGAGRGKGKPKGKGGRGSGNRMVIDNEEEMAIRDQQIEAGREARAKRRAEADEDEEENEEVANSFLKQANAFNDTDCCLLGTQEAVPTTVFKRPAELAAHPNPNFASESETTSRRERWACSRLTVWDCRLIFSTSQRSCGGTEETGRLYAQALSG
jgi:hypothetical protein